MARSFPGSTNTDVVAVPTYPNINGLAPITFSCWFKLTAAPDSTSRYFYAKLNHSSLYIDNSGDLSFEADLWSTTTGAWGFAYGSLTTGAWHHLVVTYDYKLTTDVPSFYLDGVLQTLVTFATPAGTVGSDTAELYIGNVSAGTRCFNGVIAEVGLYNELFGQKQVNMARRATWLPNNMVGYWPLWGLSATEVNLSNATTVASTGVSGNGTVTGTTKANNPPVSAYGIVPNVSGYAPSTVKAYPYGWRTVTGTPRTVHEMVSY